MGFLKEAKDRWGTAVPPFFKKLQLIMVAVAAAGTSLAAIPIPAGWDWVNKVGLVLIGGAAFGGVVAQFVMNITAILAPGESLHNDTGNSVEVAVVSPSSPPTMSGLSVDGEDKK